MRGLLGLCVHQSISYTFCCFLSLASFLQTSIIFSSEEDGIQEGVTFWSREGALAGPCPMGSVRSISTLGKGYLSSWVTKKKVSFGKSGPL